MHACNPSHQCGADAGYHRFLGQDCTELREQGATLNPKTFPRSQADAPAPVYTSADALAPVAKTRADMMQYARESDLACAADIKRSSNHHPQKRTGVHASHAFQKVPGQDDEGGRKPEPMHTIGGEVTAVTAMASGGTASMYSVKRLPEVAKWEISLNSRWSDELSPYLHGTSVNSVEWIADILCLHFFAYKLNSIAGDTSKPDLPWAASAEQLVNTLRLCKGMRDYNHVVCLPAGIKSVEFGKAFGEPGKMKTWEYLLLAGSYGKHLLEECFSPNVQQVVFEYLDLLGLMWEKSISAETLSHLEKRLPIVLTMMEDLLPSWELDMNRHQIIHLVAAIHRANGPC